MSLSPENIERLKKVVIISVPAVLGAMAVKNIREHSQTKHLSYWEASRSFIIDLIDERSDDMLRLSGTLTRGLGDGEGISDIELYDGFRYDDEDITRLEQAFIGECKKED